MKQPTDLEIIRAVERWIMCDDCDDDAMFAEVERLRDAQKGVKKWVLN